MPFHLCWSIFLAGFIMLHCTWSDVFRKQHVALVCPFMCVACMPLRGGTVLCVSWYFSSLRRGVVLVVWNESQNCGGIFTHTLTLTHTHTQPGESETVQTHQSVLTDQSSGRHVRRGTQSKRRRENRREIDLTSLQGHVHVRSSQRDCSSRRAGLCASLRERQGEV